MMIPHPLLGLRDASEFTYLGDASLLDRPNWQDKNAKTQFYEYAYLRDNPAGLPPRVMVPRTRRPLVVSGNAQHSYPRNCLCRIGSERKKRK